MVIKIKKGINVMINFGGLIRNLENLMDYLRNMLILSIKIYNLLGNVNLLQVTRLTNYNWSLYIKIKHRPLRHNLPNSIEIPS